MKHLYNTLTWQSMNSMILSTRKTNSCKSRRSGSINKHNILVYTRGLRLVRESQEGSIRKHFKHPSRIIVK